MTEPSRIRPQDAFKCQCGESSATRGETGDEHAARTGHGQLRMPWERPALTVEVGVQTLTLTCDGCGQTQEVVLKGTEPDDVLLPSLEQFRAAHGGARRPKVELSRWTLGGQKQTGTGQTSNASYEQETRDA